MTLTMHQPHNIFAGTQVVSLVEVRGTNHSLVHPRGAVGVVTRTPTGTETRFLVRFPDGFEASLDRNEIDVLKHFKDRLPSAPTQPGFDLEDYVIYRCTVGSRAYGLDGEDSDTDVRGVYLAPAEMQWSLFGAPEQFEDDASQSCYWELQKFLGMALKANPNILECLYSPLVDKQTQLGTELIALRDAFLSRMIYQTFNGYAMSQFKKIGYVLEQLFSPLVVQTSPTHEQMKALAVGCITRHHSHHYFGFAETQWKLFSKEQPRRVKPLLYVYRVLLTGIHLLRTGRIEANLAILNEDFQLPFIPELIARKLGGPEQSILPDADIAFHETQYERLRTQLQEAHNASSLPELPSDTTRAALDDLLIHTRLAGRA